MPRRGLLLYLSLAFATLPAISQQHFPSKLLTAPVTPKTAISFFWYGDLWSHFRQPMNFYVAPASDPKIHTVQVDPNGTGYSVFISATEMQGLVQQLTNANFDWNDSKTVESFKTWRERQSDLSFDITVVTAKGTAKASIRLTRMCDELAKLDSVMPTPFLRWSFQSLRFDDGCIISTFDPGSRPAQ